MQQRALECLWLQKLPQQLNAVDPLRSHVYLLHFLSAVDSLWIPNFEKAKFCLII
jgi:hypothetical protein